MGNEMKNLFSVDNLAQNNKKNFNVFPVNFWEHRSVIHFLYSIQYFYMYIVSPSHGGIYGAAQGGEND